MENTLLNLIPAAYLPEIHLSQYDVGRTITFTLKDGASDYSVPSGASVKVKATKPSGFGFEVACTFNGGTVTLVTTDTMTPENGRFPAELSIVSGNTTIGTSNFIFNIERSPHPEGTIDGDAETIIPELTLLVERIEAAAEDVDEKAELFLNLSAEAETLPAGSLATANYSDGVLTLGIPRGYDGDDTKADAIVKSASGEVASFSDGGNGLLVKSLNVNITPKQSGSGDPSPSNVRPISGWDSVDINVTGINIWDEEWEVGGIDPNSGTNAEYSTRIRSKNYIPLVSGIAYSFNYVGSSISSNGLAVVFYDSNKEYVQGSWRQNSFSPFTVAPNVKYMRFATGDGYGATYNNDISINYPATDTSYHIGVNNESYPISLGQTVYGGVLDVVSGKLTIDTIYVDLGGQWWAHEFVNGRYRWFADTSAFAKNEMGAILCCSQFAVNESPITGSGVDNTITTYSTGGTYLNCFSKDSMTNEEFKQAMSGVIAIYKWNSTTEIQLTPTEVKTLLGNNNIFADGGSVEVEYRADTTLAYNELLSLIASL